MVHETSSDNTGSVDCSTADQQQQRNSVPMKTNQVAPYGADGELENETKLSVVVPASDVGAAFALQYFHIMKNRPEDLPHFYNEQSRSTRVMPGEKGAMQCDKAIGLQNIGRMLKKYHFGSGLMVVVINTMDCQDSPPFGVFLQLLGTLKFADDTSRDFVMSVLLVREQNTSTLGYFILNDVFTFTQASLFKQMGNVLTCCEAEAEDIHPKIAQNQTLSPATPVPATAVIAASAQPGAAPLPTTTAPRLSGGSSPHGPISPSLDPQNETVKLDQLKNLETAQLKNLETAQLKNLEEDQSIEEPERKAQSMSQPLSINDEISNDTNKDIMSVIAAAPPVSTLESDQATLKKSTPEISGAANAESGTSIKTNAWEPITPKIVPDDVFNKPQQAQSKPLSKQMKVEPLQSRELNYSKNSYAGALLLTGGPTRPFMVGYSLPPEVRRDTPESTAVSDGIGTGGHFESRSNGSNSRRPFKRAQEPLQKPSSLDNNLSSSVQKNESHGENNGRGPYRSRGKTLWVAAVPNDMSEDNIKKVIADQLKECVPEGHVVRVEKVSGQAYGYIEFDTEISTRFMLENGLYLQGKQVSVAYPAKRNPNFVAGQRGNQQFNRGANNYRGPRRGGMTGNNPPGPPRPGMRAELKGESEANTGEGWTLSGRKHQKRFDGAQGRKNPPIQRGPFNDAKRPIGQPVN